MNKIEILRFALIVIASFALSACSTYKSKFRCGEATGLSCMMLSEINRQISSGEIEEVEKQKKCKGRNCKAKSRNKSLPKLKQDHRLELLLMDDSPNEEDEIIEEFVIETDSAN